MIDIQLGEEIAKKIMNDTFGDIKMRTPIDTTTRFSTEPLEIERTERNRPLIFNETWFVDKTKLHETVQETLDRIRNYEQKGETMNKILIPEYVGYKGKTITLVWSDDTTTKATYKEDGQQDISFLYGFLIAYYKKVHENLNSKQLQAKLNYSIYEKDMNYQIGYLMSVFEENCGLSHKKQQQFIGNYILILAPFEVDPFDLKRVI